MIKGRLPASERIDKFKDRGVEATSRYGRPSEIYTNLRRDQRSDCCAVTASRTIRRGSLASPASQLNGQRYP
jgi:hypothetical protein